MKKTFFLLFLILGFACAVNAQFMNKEIKAAILVEQNSAFYTFKAVAENLTTSDVNLRYQYILYRTDENNNTQKSQQEDRFFLKSYTKNILASVTVNYNIRDKVILVLLIYDKNDKPVGQARIELPKGGQTKIETMTQNQPVSADQARPTDGFVIQGFVVENTITKAGRDFYRFFYSDYYNRQIVTNKNIVINEIPGRSLNTMISIEIEGREIWRFFAQPRRDFLKKMALIAMNRSIAYLQQLQQRQEQLIKY